MTPTAINNATEVIDFASRLHNILLTLSSEPVEIPADLSQYLHGVPIPFLNVSKREREDVRQNAISLWNTCNSIYRDDSKQMQHRALIAKSKAFAFLLLDSIELPGSNVAHSCTSSSRSSSPRIEKHIELGIEATRPCIQCSELDLAECIIAVIAKRCCEFPDEVTIAVPKGNVHAEFICLRLALAWKRNRLDIAAHWYRRLMDGITSDVLSSCLETKILDLCYEIGMSEMEQLRFGSALQWLQNAQDQVELASGSSTISTEFYDMKLNVLHASIRCLLSLDNPDARRQASDILTKLKHEFPKKLAVTILQLEFQKGDAQCTAEIFVTELMILIKSLYITNSNHQLIMHYIHYLKNLSVDHALKCLQQYILQRLIHHSRPDLTERAMITYIWITVHTENDGNSLDIAFATKACNSFHQNWNQGLSSAAAHAALTVLWKKVDQLEFRTDQSSLELVQLMLHPLFDQAEDLHKGKVKRMLMAIYLSAANVQAAESTVESMSKYEKSHPTTMLLTYSLSLQTKRPEAARTVLSSIFSRPLGDDKIIFACVGEAMKHGTKLQTACLLQRLVDRYTGEVSAEVDMPMLLKCTASLLEQVASDPAAEQENVKLRLCSIFKTAASYSRGEDPHRKDPKQTLSIADRKWFEQHSYNVAMTYIGTWPAKYIIDLLEHSGQVEYDTTQGYEKTELQHRKRRHDERIAFVQAVLYANESRSCLSTWTLDDIPRSSYSGRSRPHAGGFRHFLCKNVFDQHTKLWQALTEKKSSEATENELLRSQVYSTLPLALEALIGMSQGPSEIGIGSAPVDELSLGQIVEQAARIQAPIRTFAILADLILASASHEFRTCAGRFLEITESTPPPLPAQVAAQLLGKIVLAIRDLESYNIEQAARWIRCIVQLIAKDDRPSAFNESSISTSSIAPRLPLLFSVTDQALHLARAALQTLTSNQLNFHGDGNAISRTSPEASRPQHRRSTAVISTTQYPPEELEYLSVSLFNLSIDLYIVGNEAKARNCAVRAVEIADLLDSTSSNSTSNNSEPNIPNSKSSTMAGMLRQKCTRLGWNI